MRRLVRAVGIVIGAATLAASGSAVLPLAGTVLHLRSVADDPVALADARLTGTLTRERVRSEIEAAVAAEDEELAESFIALAEARGIVPEPAWQDALDELRRSATIRAARDFGRGFLDGGTDNMAGLAGGVAADVVGYGDLRDLYAEGSKLVSGQDHDEIVLGMATVGLAVSAATLASLGAAAPARGGLTALKTAKKTGRLSRPLTVTLSRMSREVVDGDAMKGALTAARRLDLAGARLAARGAIRSQAVTGLKAVADDAATLFGRVGPRGAVQALALAENADDVRRASRLADAFGSRTRAVLTVLGRGALVLGSAFASLVQWVWAGLAWLFALVLLARQLGLLIGEAVWRR